MKSVYFSLAAALLTLAACGADGAPTRPGAEPAVSVTGKAETGVAG